MRKLRNEKRMSQTEVAKVMDMLPNQYNKFENGKMSPSLESLTKIAEALEVSLDQIVYGKQRFAAANKNKEQEIIISNTELVQKMKVISELPDDDLYIAIEVIDLIVAKKQLREIANNFQKKQHPGYKG